MSSTELTSELQALRKENEDLKEQNADLLAELESLKKENLELRNSQPLSVQIVSEPPQLVNQTELAVEASTSELSKEKDDVHISKQKVKETQSKFLPKNNEPMKKTWSAKPKIDPDDEGKQKDVEKSTIAKLQLGEAESAKVIDESTKAKSDEAKVGQGFNVKKMEGSEGSPRSQLAGSIAAHLQEKSVSQKVKSKKSETVVKSEVKEGEGEGKLVKSKPSKSQDKKVKTKAVSVVANSARPIAEAEEEKSKPIKKLKSKPKKRKPKKLNKGLLMFEKSGGKIESPKVKSASVKKRKKKKGKRKTGKLALKFANMPVMGMASPKGRPRSNTSPSRRSSNFEDDEKKENVDTNQMIRARPCITHIRRARTRHLKG